jgi:azurin
VKPGTADKVANQSISLGADGFKMGFVPDSPDILFASKLLDPGKQETLEITLDQPGNYPFVCTFPGHAILMRGEIIVK